MTAPTISIGNGVRLGSGIGVGTFGLPITITYSQIVDPGDGTLTGTGFTGTYCLIELTSDQLEALTNAGGGPGWGYLLCIGTWSAGSVNTTPNDGDVVIATSGTPGVYSLYGTLSGWPDPQPGPWNLPVIVSAVAGGG